MRKHLRNALVGSAVAIALVGSTAPLSVTSVAAAEAGPIEAATLSPTSGSSTTAFQLDLGANPSCPGDTATGGYRWQTFLVAADTDPALLTFGSGGPVSTDGGFASPLFDTFSEAVVNRSTAQAVGSDPEGGIFGIPSFSLAVFDDGDLPPGQYTAGVACTKGPFGPVQVSNLWTVDLRVTPTPSGPSWSTVDPVDNGAASLSVVAGDSSTAFSLGLGANPSCPGDSAGAGYRWQTFMVPAGADLSALSFTTAGPVKVDGEFRTPLFTIGGDPVANRLTDQAVGPAVTGGISGIPQLNLAVYEPGDIPAGEYAVGVACTLGVPGADQLKSFWSTTIRVATTGAGAGGPAQVSWSTDDAPVDNGAASLSVVAGDSSTAFSLGLGANPSCPGDSAGAGYRWQTFMVPAGADLSALSFTTAGPVKVDGEFRTPLFTIGGDPVANRLTDQAVGPAVTGGISGIPQLNLAVYEPGDIPAGEYAVGVACTLGVPGADQLKSFWSTTIAVTANSGGSDPARIDWAGVPEAPVAVTTDPAEGSVTLSWDAAGSDSSAATTGYLVTTDAGIRSCVAPAGTTSCTVVGLPTDGEFTFVVRAVGPAGTSGASALSNVVTPGGGSATPQFDDVPAGQYFVRATSMLKDRGITTGKGSPDTFAPQERVTRAEMATFLYRLAGEPPAPPHTFQDESSIPSWARVATDWLWAEGLTDNDPFRPTGLVTRAQMAAFLWRLAGEPTAPAHTFDDEGSIPEWALSATDWMYETGITTNDPYDPRANVSRGQMAAFLYRTGAVFGLWVRVDDP